MSNIDFSVIIVSYKNLQIIIDCLESIKRYNDIEERLEVIIVDNSPSDDIFRYVQNCYQWVKIIRNENKGFGQGNNVGARIAKGRYLVFLNPDTILIEPIFQFAINQFVIRPNLGLFGVKLVDRNLKRNTSFYFMDLYGFLVMQAEKLANRLDIYLNGLMYIAGANIFIRKDVFIDSGMFDEKIFMYYEEADLIKRILKLSMKTAYFPSKQIIHLEGKTTTDNEVALRRRLDAKRYYCDKYGLDYRRRLRSEMRYEYFKSLVYKIQGNRKSNVCRNNVRVILEYLRMGLN